MTYLQTMEGPKSPSRNPYYDPIQAPSTRPEEPDTLDRLTHMPLSEFAQAGLVVQVHSRALGQSVLFASDNATIENDEGLSVYRASELIDLVGSRDPDLTAIDRRKAAKTAS
jgi:hypothetical protein